MTELYKNGVYMVNGKPVPADRAGRAEAPGSAREKTMAYRILRKHDTGANPKKLRLKFDALVSHDITYVGIIRRPAPLG
jgi:aconitate hydratase